MRPLQHLGSALCLGRAYSLHSGSHDVAGRSRGFSTELAAGLLHFRRVFCIFGTILHCFEPAAEATFFGQQRDRAAVGAAKVDEAATTDLQNELRNAQRRRTRLKHKARLLTTADLLEVMQLRQDENVSKVASTASGEPAALGDADVHDGEEPRSVSPSPDAEENKAEENADE